MKNEILSYNFLINRIVRALNDKRLNASVCNRFKEDIKKVKDFYGIELSKEFLIPFYKPNQDNKQEKELSFKQRLSRVMEKADLKTEARLRLFDTFTSQNGNLFIQKDREFINFFIV
jgi:hypothetical protein